jgi:hypothetical protein
MLLLVLCKVGVLLRFIAASSAVPSMKAMFQAEIVAGAISGSP